MSQNAAKNAEFSAIQSKIPETIFRIKVKMASQYSKCNVASTASAITHASENATASES